MNYLSVLKKLCYAFPKGRFKKEFAFIPYPSASFLVISLKEAATLEEHEATILEDLSRAAFKTAPFRSPKANEHFHEYIRDGINSFCGTGFTEIDMEEIYTHLGNGIDHEKTMRFVRSGYDIAILKLEGATENDEN